VGSVVSAVGAGLIKTTDVLGWIVVVLGVLLAIAGSVFSANNYVRNRSQRLRFLRLLHDICDFAYLLLPTAAPVDAFTQLGAIRTEWETAGG
jgi:sulfite exporter TauE/SafE